MSPSAHAVFPGGHLRRPCLRQCHEFVVAADVVGDKSRIVRANPFELHCEREPEQHVGTGPQRQMQIRLLGNLGAAAGRSLLGQLSSPVALSWVWRTRCKLATVALLPQTMFMAAFALASGPIPGTAPCGARPGLVAVPRRIGVLPAMKLAGAEAMKETQRHTVRVDNMPCGGQRS